MGVRVRRVDPFGGRLVYFRFEPLLHSGATLIALEAAFPERHLQPVALPGEVLEGRAVHEALLAIYHQETVDVAQSGFQLLRRVTVEEPVLL